MGSEEDPRPCGDQHFEIVFDEGPPPGRQSWDVYFMNIARQVASRGTCHRKHVGCVIVRDRIILATGYNGSIRGMPHCDEVGHMMENGHCTRTAHAEQNAIAQAARYGISVDGAEAYITASPCWVCFKIMANAGLKRIVFGEFYRDDRIFDASEHIGIELAMLDTTDELKMFVKGK
ncbi:MAG: dCMP deaminase family protein [Candidatus Thermoplasmatota archaeon]|nr:dCMP deaminase family protein [Candidatus Thermoplasmatota archaeon]